MPWEIKKQGNGFALVNQDTGKMVAGGYHADYDSARQHQKALYANAGPEASGHKTKSGAKKK